MNFLQRVSAAIFGPPAAAPELMRRVPQVAAGRTLKAWGNDSDRWYVNPRNGDVGVLLDSPLVAVDGTEVHGMVFFTDRAGLTNYYIHYTRCQPFQWQAALQAAY